MKARHLETGLDGRGVFSFTLNRPDKRNAFNAELIAEMSATLDAVARNSEVKAVLIGAHGKHFCAGADLEWMRRMAAASEEENLLDADALAAMLRQLDTLPVPTIAKVRGAAMGGGCGLLCCCDLAIAADNAAFAFSEARLGLIPATISPYVIRSIGAKNARRYFLTAERFDAARALALGLVSEVVAADEIDARVETLLQSILANGGEAVKAAKRLVFEVAGKAVTPELMRHTSAQIAALRASEPTRERIENFLKKT